MTSPTKIFAPVACALILSAYGLPVLAQSAAPKLSSTPAPAAVTTLYNQEEAAIAARDYAKFVGQGTPMFKQKLTKDLFSAACADSSDHFKSGYVSKYVGQTVIQGSPVYVWNVACKDGTAYHASMGVTGGKIAGFFLQPGAMMQS